jgi:hypothetical protein
MRALGVASRCESAVRLLTARPMRSRIAVNIGDAILHCSQAFVAHEHVALHEP